MFLNLNSSRKCVIKKCDNTEGVIIITQKQKHQKKMLLTFAECSLLPRLNFGDLLTTPWKISNGKRIIKVFHFSEIVVITRSKPFETGSKIQSRITLTYQEYNNLITVGNQNKQPDNERSSNRLLCGTACSGL